MNTALLIWAYLSLGSILMTLTIVASVVGIMMIMGTIGYSCETNSFAWLKEIPHKFKVAMFYLTLMLFSAAYPSQDDLKFIIGGAAVVGLTQVEGVSELPENLMAVANQFLEGIVVEDVVEEVLDGSDS